MSTSWYLNAIYLSYLPVHLRLEKTWNKMQTEADFEIINLNPNVTYEESDLDDDIDESEAFVEEENEIYHQKKEEQELQHIEDDSMSNSNDSYGSNNVKRRKLNLEEYKIKRAKQPAPATSIDNRNMLELCEVIPETLPPISLPTDPRAIKNFLNQVSLKKHEEKLQRDEEDNIEVVEQQKEEEITIHPDYEEIILVSIACNTDISMPPNELECLENQSNSVGTKFLTNIVNNFEKDNAETLLANSSANSLFSSINAVLQEQCSKSTTDNEVHNLIENKSVKEHHGEDKVIMHLRKDRIRPHRSTRSLQTDVTPLFPPLILSPALIFNRIKNIRNFRRKSSRSRSRSRSRSISPESDYYGHGSYNFHTSDFNTTRFNHSTYSSSMNSSEMESYSSDSDSSAYSSGRSSDQGSVRRFNNYKNYRMHKQQQRNNNHETYRGKIEREDERFTFYVFNLFLEERKIIYVGEILKETTKDELRRKFLKYGSIKKISIHSKDDG